MGLELPCTVRNWLLSSTRNQEQQHKIPYSITNIKHEITLPPILPFHHDEFIAYSGNSVSNILLAIVIFFFIRKYTH